MCGILFASPVIFQQIWRFVAPGLYRHEKRIALPFVFISTCCFLAGASFGYFIVFPPVFHFLTGYASKTLEPLPAVSEYFSLAIRLLFAFGIIFELPVLMVFLAKIGFISIEFLRQNRKYAILICFIAAAVLTPTPDVINQVLLAVPLIILYEISILMILLFGRKTFSGFSGEQPPDEENHPESADNQGT